jgi:hypothetical protein
MSDDPRCAACGHPRSNHPYRHPFVGPSRDDTIKTQADRIEQLAATCEELEAKLAWQPIETAPMDGSFILAVLRDKALCGNSVFVVGFDSDFEYWCCDDPIGSWVEVQPTHWIPLPDGPKELKGQDDE